VKWYASKQTKNMHEILLYFNEKVNSMAVFSTSGYMIWAMCAMKFLNYIHIFTNYPINWCVFIVRSSKVLPLQEIEQFLYQYSLVSSSTGTNNFKIFVNKIHLKVTVNS
jgi:hypothetical protein